MAAGDGPLRSLGRAQAILRQLGADAPEGITVWLRGGCHRLEETWRFGPEDPPGVTWAAWPGEEAVLEAGVELPPWQEREGEWICPAGPLLERWGRPAQLHVGGVRARSATWPATGSIPLALPEGAGPDRQSILHIPPGSLPAGLDPVGAEALVLHLFAAERVEIVSWDAASGALGFAIPQRRPVEPDLPAGWRAGLRLEHAHGCPLEPGMWTISGDLLRYRPRPGERPTGAVAGVLPEILRLEGTPQQSLTGLRFRDLVFRHAGRRPSVFSSQSEAGASGAIVLHHVRDGGFTGCRIVGCGSWGIELAEGCQGVEVEGCQFDDLGAGGVHIHHAVPLADQGAGRHAKGVGSSGCRIAGCRITRCGRILPAASGILVRDCGGCRIERNRIEDLYYSGIAVGWVWGFWPSRAAEVLIEGNLVRRCGQGELSDLGGIYLLGARNCVVRGNVLEEIRHSWYGACGVFLDEGCCGVVVEGNLVRGVDAYGLHLHFGRENTFRRNLVLDARGACVALSRSEPMTWPEKGLPGEDSGLLAFTCLRNILVADGTPMFIGGPGDATGALARARFESDCNLLWDRQDGLLSGDGPHRSTKASLAPAYDLTAWRALGRDRASVVADPHLELPTAGLPRLAPDSPAHALGIRLPAWPMFAAKT